MTVLAIITTLVCGFLVLVLGATIGLPEIGAIAAIAVMGGFILHAVRKNKPKE